MKLCDTMFVGGGQVVPETLTNNIAGSAALAEVCVLLSAVLVCIRVGY